MLLHDGVELDGNLLAVQAKKGPKGGGRKIEAAIDSGAVDAVANPRDFPDARVVPTPESKRGEEWVCAGGKGIPKLGRMTINFKTDEGKEMKISMKAGAVNKTLIGANKLIDAGYEVYLNKDPKIIHAKTREVIPLKRKGGMFIMNMWIPVGNEAGHFGRQGS